MNKYETSYIYKLCCKDTSIKEIYVGSTTSFSTRKASHKYTCKTEKCKGYNIELYQFIRDNGGFDNFKFIVLEHYRGEEEDLRQLEQLWYNTFPKELLLNSQFPKTSRKEYLEKYNKDYYDKHKEEIKLEKKEYSKNYRLKNKATEKTHCPKCLKSMSKGYISRHLKVCPKN
jgi:hypothetical protein